MVVELREVLCLRLQFLYWRRLYERDLPDPLVYLRILRVKIALQNLELAGASVDTAALRRSTLTLIQLYLDSFLAGRRDQAEIDTTTLFF